MYTYLLQVIWHSIRHKSYKQLKLDMIQGSDLIDIGSKLIYCLSANEFWENWTCKSIYLWVNRFTTYLPTNIEIWGHVNRFTQGSKSIYLWKIQKITNIHAWNWLGVHGYQLILWTSSKFIPKPIFF